MPKLAANLSTLFPQLEFAERFAAAAKAGFRYVEYQFPYPWRPDELANRARDAGVQVVLHNLPAGDFAKGERGIACLPGREREFREGVERGIDYAKAVSCPRLNCLAGLAPADREHFDAAGRERALRRAQARRSRAAAGDRADQHAQRAGVLLVALGAGDRGAERGGRGQCVPAVRLLPHADHGRRPGEERRAAAARIGHIQLADVPGRHEPGSGEINFDFLLRHLDALGYSGWVGCEYNPKGDTLEGLKWAQPYLS